MGVAMDVLAESLSERRAGRLGRDDPARCGEGVQPLALRVALALVRRC